MIIFIFRKAFGAAEMQLSIGRSLDNFLSWPLVDSVNRQAIVGLHVKRSRIHRRASCVCFFAPPAPPAPLRTHVPTANQKCVHGSRVLPRGGSSAPCAAGRLTFFPGTGDLSTQSAHHALKLMRTWGTLCSYAPGFGKRNKGLGPYGKAR